MKRLLNLLLLAVACAALPGFAQQFPSRPVRLVVPYPPGGANDIVARLLAPGMGAQLGQNVVVDNRGGANTIIGSELVATAAPNGHTILIIAAGHAINPSLYHNLPYNTARDFAPIALVGDGAYVLVAHPSLALASSADLIALAKSKPGQIAYASSSIGNLTHLAAELFNSLAGIKMLHVPYKGGNPAMLDLLGGRVSVFFSTVAVARPHLQTGRIKGLGVTTARRSLALPDVPTIAESGLPGYAVSGWYGLVAPAATPKAAIGRLHSVVQVALRQTEIREKLLGVGIEVVDATTARFGELITAELAKWDKVVKPLGITPE
ncbi:MAG: tripartite tricarboxylate transporter substrate binding protein [Betaproteobacteria bacterium]|nr:tripartite tricarboxylate transporter substrate binding protein [Betaproteobacteria bacterium]MBI2225713.1 tripartite tricarboxylate transporter substrate binding protein [Betaproteobacteria bacterium]